MGGYLRSYLGAQRPVGRPAPGGGPFEGPSGPAQGGPCNVVSPADSSGGARLSLEESRRKEHQGGERFSPPWTHLSLVFARREVVFFLSYLACGPVSHARNGPPPSWAGWEGWFLRREGLFLPQSLPLGGKVPQCAHWGG